ncbi:MAG: hypothetical protein F6K21_18360 [Symploca sp. SIO2D2]|nr:hypothetical protein [Symploca sp. SIO2D2]
MASVDFSSYLNFVRSNPRYQETLSRYTVTDAHLVLEAQTVVREESEGRETEKPRQQVERFPVLEGLRKYAANHVLLSGKPGSGKSTTLKRLLLEMAKVNLSSSTDSAPLTPQLWGEPESQSSPWERLKSQSSPPPLPPNSGGNKRMLRCLTDGDLGGKNQEKPKIPVLVQLKSECPILETIREEFRKGQLLVSNKDIDNWLVEGKLFLLLDGVNEIPSEELRRELQRFQSEVLQHLAFEMLRGDRDKPTEAWLTVSRSKAEGILEAWLGKRGVSDAATKGKEWLEDLLEHHLLQVAANPREIEFHHQLFQEYYAAEALLVMVEKRDPYLIDDEQWQHFFLNYLKWTESIALMLGLLENEEQALWMVELAFAVDLMLGARLAGEVKSEFQQQTLDLIESVKVPRRWKFWFITHKRWVSIPEWLRVELLEKMRSDIVIPGLLNALQHENSDVRWRVAWVLENLGSPEAIPGLLNALQDENSNVRQSAVRALENLGSPEAVPELLKSLQDEDSFVRKSAVRALET